MAASLILGGGHPLNTTCKSPFTPLFLSTTCKTTLSLSLPFPALSLSLSSRLSLLPIRQKRSSRSDFPQVNEWLDWFDKATMGFKGMTEKTRNDYDMKLEKLLDKAKNDEAVLLKGVTVLQNCFWGVIVKQSDECDFVVPIHALLDWFEKEAMESKEMIDKLRDEMIIHKLLLDEAEENTVLEEMFWNLSEKQAKTIQAKVKAGYILNKPIMKRQVKDFSLGLNQLLDWFEKETMESKGMTENLREKSEMIAQKILEDEYKYDWLKDMEEMFYNLKKKQEKSIIAKRRRPNSKAAMLSYPLFYF